MKGIRASLVLLPPDLGADPSPNPFEQWLDTAGWDADVLQLRPPFTHPTLGWKNNHYWPKIASYSLLQAPRRVQSGFTMIP